MNESSPTNGVLTRLQRQFSSENRILLLLWLSLMILTPYALHFGSQPALTLTLTLSTAAQGGLVLGLLKTAWNATRIFGIGLFVAVMAWMVEYAGAGAPGQPCWPLLLVIAGIAVRGFSPGAAVSVWQMPCGCPPRSC